MSAQILDVRNADDKAAQSTPIKFIHRWSRWCFSTPFEKEEIYFTPTQPHFPPVHSSFLVIRRWTFSAAPFF